MAKIDLGKLFNIVTIVGPLVSEVQKRWKGAKTGPEKKDVVVETIREALPVVENVIGKDLLDDALFNLAISDLIDLEKAVQTARQRVADLVAARRAAAGEE